MVEAPNIEFPTTRTQPRVSQRSTVHQSSKVFHTISLHLFLLFHSSHQHTKANNSDSYTCFQYAMRILACLVVLLSSFVLVSAVKTLTDETWIESVTDKSVFIFFDVPEVRTLLEQTRQWPPLVLKRTLRSATHVLSTDDWSWKFQRKIR